MNLSDFLKNLQLDTWYKAFMYIGGIVLVGSFFLEVKGITNTQLQLVSAGLFFIGIGEWKNHKSESFIKPPNAYTGPAALITHSVWKPDLIGLLLDVAGLVLMIMGIRSIFFSPTSTAAIPSVVASTAVISAVTHWHGSVQ